MAVAAHSTPVSPELTRKLYSALPASDGSVPAGIVASPACSAAIVANCVVFVPTAAVGPDGTPVKVGDARGAFKTISELTVANPV